MPNELDDLLERLRAWIKANDYGAQTRLANELGVSVKKLNHWVTGYRNPTALDALRLQAFLKKHR
jgi:DNA-binding transcriptional regulator YdaS (Cro superfamily)